MPAGADARCGLGRRRGVAAQHSPDPRQHLAHVERLGDVVVGAELQPDHAVDHVAFAADHHDRYVVLGADLAREREAVLAREADVEGDEIDGLRVEVRHQAGAVLGLGDGKALRLQAGAQQRAHLGLVVDDQDVNGGRPHHLRGLFSVFGRPGVGRQRHRAARSRRRSTRYSRAQILTSATHGRGLRLVCLASNGLSAKEATMLAMTLSPDLATKRDIFGVPADGPGNGRTVDQRLRAAAPRVLQAREHVFFEGDAKDHVYLVEKGTVCLYKTLPDGRRQIVDFAYPGDFIGLGAPGDHVFSAQAITLDAAALPARRASCTRWRCTIPQVGMQLYRALSDQLLAARDLLLTVGQRNATERLGALLLALSRRNERNGADPDAHRAADDARRHRRFPEPDHRDGEPNVHQAAPERDHRPGAKLARRHPRSGRRSSGSPRERCKG